MNARQKAKKYKKLYERLKNTPSKIEIQYPNNLVRFKENIRKSVDRYDIENFGDVWIDISERQMKYELLEKISEFIPVKFIVDNNTIIGTAEVWINRETLNADKR